MKTTLKCITLWAAFAASYASADAAVKPDPKRMWGASVSLDAVGINATATNRMRSATDQDIWSKTSNSRRKILPGFTVQGTIDIGSTPYFAGLELAYTSGTIKLQSHFWNLTAAGQSYAHHHKRVSGMFHGGVILGRRFNDWSLHLKTGIATAKMQHTMHIYPNRTDLRYSKRKSGYFVGVGCVHDVTQNFAIGVDYEFTKYAQERRPYLHSGAFPAARQTKGYFKSQVQTDTLKLRLIYKI